MKRKAFGFGALVGGLLTAPLVALMYLGAELAGLPFPPFDVFNWISGLLPGPVITFGIDLMIDTLLALGVSVADTAKTAEQAMAVILFLLLGVLTGGIFFLVFEMRKVQVDRLTGLVVGALFGLPIAAVSVVTGDADIYPAISFAWLLALFLAWGLALGASYRRIISGGPTEEAVIGEARGVQRLNRRQFLILLGGSAATITVIGTGLGAVLSGAERRRQEAALAMSEAHETESSEGASFPNSDDPVAPAPGTRPEYTPLKDHYKVFIELEPTEIDGATWQLPITGLVANPLMLTLDDIRNNYPSRDQYVTLSCISGRVGTTLISTTQWTGASLQDVLADAQVQEGARYLVISSGDGFYETVDLDLIASDERIMLAYDWDGNPIPADHGFPLRIWIPDRFGMKQPKWITSIEVVDEYVEGYWVERGWDEVAQVKTTSVIDTVALDAVIENGGQRLVPVGGIAFSGARGISKVEVRVDGGSWELAQLRSPLSETTWAIWRYDWPFEAGEHTFEVRCAEADGTPQIETAQDSRPSGATGIHSRDASI
ncbi:MAG TPA: molybdopterin-dependent oxidoreductase [Anaerolineales bacterium]|nr:molybdopterin-dependent oxidoreductase [Anaerolineales bacterium]